MHRVVKDAVNLLKAAGIETGIHLMLGLYGSEKEKRPGKVSISPVN